MDEFWTSLDEKFENPKIAENYPNNYFITVFQYILCKHAQKRYVIYDQFDEKTNPPLRSNFFVFHLGSCLTSKLKSVEKTEQINAPILLFICLVQKQTSLDEFGRVWTEEISKF